MKIVMNAVSAKIGGAVTYLTNVLRYLPLPESGYEFEVFLPPEAAEKQRGLAGNVRLAPTNVGHASGWKRIWWEQVTLRRRLKREKADLLFSTANFGMFCCPVPQVLLVRNALYFSPVYQQLFLPRYGLRTKVAFRLRRWLICRSVKSADIVMTPTRAMLDELRAYVDIPESKVLISPYGVEPPNSPPSQPEREKASQPHAVVRLLYVSLYSEHKNLNTLLKAMPILNKNGSGRFLLKTTVDPAWEAARWMVTSEDDLVLTQLRDVAPWVKILGPLPRPDTHDLYKDVDIFVFPSLVESFGHPLAEAMAYGIPVVAADTPVNREVCGEAAVFFSPFSPTDLAEQVRRVAADEALRNRLGTAGRDRVGKLFRWEAHLQRILRRASES